MRVDDKVQDAWDNWKTAYTRAIPSLETRAQPGDQVLQLRHSMGHLQALLRQPWSIGQGSHSISVPKLGGAMQESHEFTETYIKIENFESSWPKWEDSAPFQPSQFLTNCVNLAKHLSPEKLRKILASLEDNPEQTSDCLLAIFNIWTRMDQNAVKECPLLIEYHQVFTPELLDVLHVSTHAKLRLLRTIQVYLRRRVENAGFGAPSILSEINRGSFASRYFTNADDLQGHRDEIKSDSQAAYDAKRKEWEKCREQYNHFSQQIGHNTCVCTIDRDGNRDIRGCTKCYNIRKRRRLEITVHEDFIPVPEAQEAAVMLLELHIPVYLQKYRDSVWAIYAIVASPSKFGSIDAPCRIKLEEYSQLEGYMRNQSGIVTLALDKKSFLETHYEGQRVKLPRTRSYYPTHFILPTTNKKRNAGLSTLETA